MNRKNNNKLAELLDKLKKQGFTVKQVAERIGYSEHTIRTQKTKEKPSQRLINAIEKEFKKELSDKEPVDYPSDQPGDGSHKSDEDKVPYGPLQLIHSELRHIRKALVKISDHLGVPSEHTIDQGVNTNEQRQEGTAHESEQSAENQGATPIQHTSSPTIYSKGKRKSKKKDSDRSSSPDKPAQ